MLLEKGMNLFFLPLAMGKIGQTVGRQTSLGEGKLNVSHLPSVAE